MGCDIHLHQEVKINDVWEHYALRLPDRNYQIFAKMAGVRSINIVPISPPKGLPDDITNLTRFDAEYWKEDGHHWSWLNAQEIYDLVDFINNTLLLKTRDGFSWYCEEQWDICSVIVGKASLSILQREELKILGLYSGSIIDWS